MHPAHGLCWPGLRVCIANRKLSSAVFHSCLRENVSEDVTGQHQGSVHLLSAGGGPAATKVISRTSTAATAPALWKALELQALSRNASSRLIASRVILAAGSTGTARLLVRTRGWPCGFG
eukprot:GHRR01000701.1.p2 GENE.GHRR01000701.1~~GHRR01000701.1.p2  ORF type:complete len:120 (-),score=29.39 GHRR01000701.1:346-705(-)